MLNPKALVPKRYRAELGSVAHALRHLGVRVTCPCCHWSFRAFLPFGMVVKRDNALCPKCGSLERHRLLWLYLKNRTDFFSKPKRVLHFAPERIFSRIFSRMPHLEYITIDIASARAGVRADVMAIPFRDNSFDVVICNHVLEHVVDDRKAMRELYRVLKPAGWALLQSPINKQLAKTHEDPTIVSPLERERAFGQHNHLRMYGRDYGERLENSGFDVKVDAYASDLGAGSIRRYGLPDEEVYFCTKPFPIHAYERVSLAPEHRLPARAGS